ncbi:hypothetical protein [Polyangium sorediatum]|uniref:Uncharacterized protein n=1 Tax=Polyangium sorediatum TaxID=889274 RepID=A0ABT6P7G9_9BACT|nr:hypothetical protein [Polyangium sorediatum]MDI1436494.1 hypothetical protein [Polyangium sorediatum]
MPPHPPKHHHGPPHHPPPKHPLPPSTIRALLAPQRLESLLGAFIPDAADRAYVARCILEQGPTHHRGASFALLALTALLLERTGGLPAEPPAGEAVSVPLRLPPHLADENDEDQAYPLRMPLAPIEAIVSGKAPAAEALVDCLLDGPPHHALANAALVCALGALLERFPGPSGEARG